jgi:hypothetical protein
MKIAYKILLSIPSLLGLVLWLSHLTPEKFTWLLPDFATYQTWTTSINALVLLTMVILIRRLWKFETIDKSKKTQWTALIILLNFVSTLFYIWKADDQMVRENEGLRSAIRPKAKDKSKLK